MTYTVAFALAAFVPFAFAVAWLVSFPPAPRRARARTVIVFDFPAASSVLGPYP